MPAIHRRRGSGSGCAKSSNRVVSPQIPKGMYLDAAVMSDTDPDFLETLSMKIRNPPTK